MYITVISVQHTSGQMYFYFLLLSFWTETEDRTCDDVILFDAELFPSKTASARQSTDWKNRVSKNPVRKENIRAVFQIKNQLLIPKPM